MPATHQGMVLPCPRATAQPGRALTAGVDGAVLEGAGVCPDAQLPRVLWAKKAPWWSCHLRRSHQAVPTLCEGFGGRRVARGGRVPTVLTWRRTVPSAKKSGLRVSTTMRSK